MHRNTESSQKGLLSSTDHKWQLSQRLLIECAEMNEWFVSYTQFNQSKYKSALEKVHQLSINSWNCLKQMLSYQTRHFHPYFDSSKNSPNL